MTDTAITPTHDMAEKELKAMYQRLDGWKAVIIDPIIVSDLTDAQQAIVAALASLLHNRNGNLPTFLGDL